MEYSPWAMVGCWTGMGPAMGPAMGWHGEGEDFFGSPSSVVQNITGWVGNNLLVFLL
jgi:hypothetical protein